MATPRGRESLATDYVPFSDIMLFRSRAHGVCGWAIVGLQVATSETQSVKRLAVPPRIGTACVRSAASRSHFGKKQTSSGRQQMRSGDDGPNCPCSVAYGRSAPD